MSAETTPDDTDDGKANATAIGIADTDNDMGTFTGSIIPNNSTAKQALQVLETATDAAQSALNLVTGATPVTPPTANTATSIALVSGQQASGGGQTITSTAGALASLTGTTPVLRDIDLVGATGTSGTVIGVNLGNITGSTLREVSVDLNSSDGSGRTAFNLFNNVIDHMSLGLRANAPGYAYLTNNLGSTTTMDGHVLMGFNLKSGAADAIEYNNPGSAMTHNVTWGGILDAGRTGTGTAAGFGLGLAHNQGWVAGGFVSRYARTAGVHIEDGSSFGVLSSIVLRGCQLDGIWGTIGGTNHAQATPIVISGFSAEGPGSETGNSHGVYLVYSADGCASRWQLSDGYISGFETGLYLDGSGILPATSITIDNCKTVLSTANGRHYGTLFSNTSTTLFTTASATGGRAGKFVQTDSAPSNIIQHTNSSPSSPRATVDGFAFPASALTSLPSPITIPASSYMGFALFPVGKRMRGRLRISMPGSFWEGDIFSNDGVSIGVIGTPLYELISPVAVVSFQSATFAGTLTAGSPVITVTAAPPTRICAGQNLTGTNVTNSPKILRQITGSAGGAGNYLLDVPMASTYSAIDLKTLCPIYISGGQVYVYLFNGSSSPQTISACTVEFDGTYYA